MGEGTRRSILNGKLDALTVLKIYYRCDCHFLSANISVHLERSDLIHDDDICQRKYWGNPSGEIVVSTKEALTIDVV